MGIDPRLVNPGMNVRWRSTTLGVGKGSLKTPSWPPPYFAPAYDAGTDGDALAGAEWPPALTLISARCCVSACGTSRSGSALSGLIASP
jgi:hypothetical protein